MFDITGTQVARDLAALTGAAREHAILALVHAGAVPSALTTFVRVGGQHPDAADQLHAVAYEVTFDYFALGTDADYLRVPLWPGTAQRIADAWQCTLPTPRMVRQIHAQAAALVMPTAGPPRGATATYAATNARIAAQVRALGLAPGALVSGHRKDIVIARGLTSYPRNVAIFGGLKTDGTWWQPVPNVAAHANTYVDYSHGVRLVRREMWIDGVAHDIRDVLRDATLAPLVSSEGPLATLAYPLLSLPRA